MAIIEKINQLHEEMTAWRRDIHSYPEIAFEEARTSDFVAQKLESFGIQVYRGLAKTGVVGTLGNGSGGSVGLRADMDALPIQENSKKSLLLILVIIKKFFLSNLFSFKNFKKSLVLLKFTTLNEKLSLISSKILYNIGTPTMLIFCLII